MAPIESVSVRIFITTSNRLSQHPHDAFQSLPILVVEVSRTVGIEIQHPHDGAVMVTEGYDHLRPGAAIAWNVPREGVHIGHDDGEASVHRSPAHSLVCGEDQAGQGPLVYVHHQNVAP
jgi:hypothetical protein